MCPAIFIHQARPTLVFFHDDTRFLSHLELRIGGHRTVVLSSATEKTFSAQIELTTGNITLRDSFDLPENTVHIRREQLLASEILFDRMTFENFNLTPVDFTVRFWWTPILLMSSRSAAWLVKSMVSTTSQSSAIMA